MKNRILNQVLLFTKQHRFDVVLCVVIMLLCGFFVFKLYGQHHSQLATIGAEVYFEGDLPRSYNIMTNRTATAHYRIKVHPLFSLQSYIPTFIFKKIGFSTSDAVRVVVSIYGSVWGALLFLMFRLVGNSRSKATMLTALGLSCSSALFWLSVPESYALGSVSIVAALAVAAYTNSQSLSIRHYTLLSVFTFSVTITNWMAGIAAIYSNNKLKQTVKILLLTICIVTVFWALQKIIFPHTVFFIGDTEEASYIYSADWLRFKALMQTFFYHTVVMPNSYITGYNDVGWPLISIQNAPLATDSILEKLTTVLWSCVLMVSLYAMSERKNHFKLKLTLGLVTSGQLVLHLFYGSETFLYSLHFLPLLLAIVSLGLQSRYSKTITVLIILLIPLLLTSNLNKFKLVNNIAVPPTQSINN